MSGCQALSSLLVQPLSIAPCALPLDLPSPMDHNIPEPAPVPDNRDMAAVATMPPPSSTATPANRRYRPAPAKTFQCRGYGDCRMVFSRSEHLARHIRHVAPLLSCPSSDLSPESTPERDRSPAIAASSSRASTTSASMHRPSMPTSRTRTSA